MISLSDFINKKVDFFFEGENFHFNLSQSLFSSFDIDQGSKLLLKTIVKEIDIFKQESILDIGSGVGVLGIVLKKINPKLSVVCQDRDALAVEFTKKNARENRVQSITSYGALALGKPKLNNTQKDFEKYSFSMVISNLPAKAGEPILRHIIRNAPRYTEPEGYCAFVVVEPLREMIEDEINRNKFNIVNKTSTHKHTVFIYTQDKQRHLEPTSQETDELKPYLRDKIALPNGQHLDTVYGIRNFNSIDFQTKLILSLTDVQKPEGKVLIWNPYQGYIPALLLLNNREIELTISSRDYLSLAIAKHNLKKIHAKSVQYIHHPYFNNQIYTHGYFDYTIITLDTDPNIDYAIEFDYISKHIAPIDNTPRYLLIAGSSHQISGIKKVLKKKNLIKHKKNKGTSAILVWFA